VGLYNFQDRFAAPILAGTKQHTIRATRINPDKPGNTLHLYTGLRTKKAKLLMRVLCVKVEEIRILLESDNVRTVLFRHTNYVVEIAGATLDSSEKEALARRDGFVNFREMIEFWNGRLPFDGHIIHWKWNERRLLNSDGTRFLASGSELSRGL